MSFSIFRRAWWTIWAAITFTLPAMYKHRPLQDPKSTIRLLTICRIPNEGEGLIEVTIKEVHEDKLGQNDYIALSYTWEKHARSSKLDRKPLHISVNGCRMTVNENLMDFLRSSTAKQCMESKRPLFIDAICIDQTSNEEKRRQLPLMSQVYENARRTIVWLGRSSSAFQLRRTNTRLDQDIRGLQSKTLCQLINNTYWERMWVVAELFLSGKVDVCIGDEHIPWSTIASVTEWQQVDRDAVVIKIVDTQRMEAEAAEEVTRRLEAMIRTVQAKKLWDERVYRNEWQHSQGHHTSLLELMQTFSERRCADERDRIYALLPLVPNCQIPVNYEPSQSIFDLFCQVVLHVFSEIQNSSGLPSEIELRDITDFLLHFWSLSQCDRRRASRLLDQKRETLLSGRRSSRRVRMRKFFGRVLCHRERR